MTNACGDRSLSCFRLVELRADGTSVGESIESLQFPRRDLGPVYTILLSHIIGRPALKD